MSPVSSTSDNEHAEASLGNAEVLTVKHAPDEPSLSPNANSSGIPSASRNRRPESRELSKDDPEISSFIGGQKTRDVFKENPRGRLRISDAYELMEESGSFSIQARTASSQAEILARRTSGNELNRGKLFISDIQNVSEYLRNGIVIAEDGLSSRIDLHSPSALHSSVF